MPVLRPGLLLLACLLLPIGAPAEDDLARAALETTESTRSPARLIEAPLSISVVSREEFFPLRAGLGIDEALDLVPGVVAQSAQNFAQDTRVAIRGFGSRASFGIRGVRILVDGVPTTLPDGQSEVDSIDLAFIDRIEVIRGPVSSLYGGGGGGMLAFETLPPSETPLISLGSRFGSHRTQRHHALAQGRLHGVGYVLGLASTRSSGYRDHARAERQTALAKLEHRFANGTWVELQFSGVWKPEAQDPGGLTQAQLDADRRQASAGSRRFDAEEDLNQQRFALRLRRSFGPRRELKLTSYFLRRDFENRLPFNRQVALDRRVTGGSLQYTDGAGPVLWIAGLDLGLQDDGRRNYQNPGGGRGPLTLEQRESVRALGGFAQGDLALPGNFNLVGGLRYDAYTFRVKDRFLADGRDDSDDLRYRELSPRIGLRWGRSPRLQVYANYGTAFRVPTTTELARSDGGGGFDSGIDPERTAGFELGFKGLLGRRLVYDVALFRLKVRNALIPFEDASQPGRTFFHNAGAVRRQGVETALSALLGPGVSIRAVYTYADYRYTDFDRLTRLAGGGVRVDELDGRTEPNTARHSLGAELRLERPSGLFATLSFRYLSGMEVDDANTRSSPGATLSDLRLGYRLRRAAVTLSPLLGVRNWTGERYVGSLRPNASGGRVFEPAPRLEVFGGLELTLALGE